MNTLNEALILMINEFKSINEVNEVYVCICNEEFSITLHKEDDERIALIKDDFTLISNGIYMYDDLNGNY